MLQWKPKFIHQKLDSNLTTKLLYIGNKHGTT